MSMEKLGAFVGGALFATVGAKILASKGAKAFNEKRAAEQAEVIEDTAEKAE